MVGRGFSLCLGHTAPLSDGHIHPSPRARVYPVAVDGQLVSAARRQPEHYALTWRRMQRLQWPHLLQMCARHHPLTLEPEVLYVLPPRFPYPVFLLLTTDRQLLLLSASVMVHHGSGGG